MGLRKGQTNNPGGRPKKSNNLIEKVRGNPKCIEVWEKIFEVALTLNTPNQHRDAMTAVKLIADKTVPSLKSQEIEVSQDTLDAIGVIILPTKKKLGDKVATK